MSLGKNVILEIEIQGALKVKERFPETELIFLTPPSASELKERLVGRGTETMDVIEGRMKRAVEEAEFIDRYDHLIINDELEACVDEVHNVIQCARSRICSRKEFAQEIKEELSQLGCLLYTSANITKELQDTLTGGRISKIAQPEKDELLLTIKSSAGQFRLCISASA